MEVILGKMAGFCPGVTNAVVKTQKHLDNIKKKQPVYCLGELIHNAQVLENLSKKGLKVVQNIEDAPNNIDLIIRAHGIPKETYEIAQSKNIKIIDLTCPKVLNIHKQAQEYKDKGYYIFLISEKNHPETIGTYSFCGENSSIIQTKEEVKDAVKKFKETKIPNIAIISQTTFSMSKFDEIVELIKSTIPKETNIEVNKTICDATRLRQKETKEIASKVELMIIIGGKNSSNTNKLYEISLQQCGNAMLIQTKQDLYINYIQRFKRVGIMAGASTPKEIIDEVVEILKNTETKNCIE